MEKTLFSIVLIIICIHFGSVIGSSDDKSKLCCPEGTKNYTINNINEEYKCIDSAKNENPFNISCERGFEEIIISNYYADYIPHDDRDYCFLKDASTQNISKVAVCYYVHIPFDTPNSKYFTIISCVFLVLTILVYLCTKTLRAPDDIAFICATICLTIFMSIAPLMPFLDEFTLTLYIYFGGSFFAWFQLLMLIQLKYNWSGQPLSKVWIIGLHIYGWGAHLLVMLLVIIAAWTRQVGLGFIVGAFILVSWIIIIVLFVMMFYYAMITTEHNTNYKLIKYKSCMYLKLFIVQFIPWTLELSRIMLFDISYYHPAQLSILNIFDYICTLQGIFVFIVMVIQRHQVRRYYGGKKILCIKFPDSWAQSDEYDEAYILSFSRFSNSNTTPTT